METNEPVVVTKKNTIIGQISVDSRLIYERLSKVEIDEVITYDELNKVIGRDVQKGAYSCLVTAKKMAERYDRKVFGTIVKIGIKRLTGNDVVDTGDGKITHMRRTAARGIRQLATVDYEVLDEKHKTKHNVTLSTMGCLQMMLKPGKLKGIEEEVKSKSSPLSLAQTLEIFKK